MATGYVGDSIRLQVTFRSWSETPETSEIEDPASVTFEVYNDAASPTLVLSATPTKVSDGIYYYIWTPTEEGTYSTIFTGTFDDASTDIVTTEFVITEDSPTTSTSSGEALGEDYEILLAGVIDPLYISPDEILPHFPEASAAYIAEIIYKYSYQAKAILNLSDDEETIPWIVMEWVAAQTACDLSREGNWGDGLGGISSVQLGDLSVRSGLGFAKGKITRDNATSWCELAGVLYKELLHYSASPKAFVRGSDYPNPIPNRDIRDWNDKGSFNFDSPLMQGLLDGLTRSN